VAIGHYPFSSSRSLAGAQAAASRTMPVGRALRMTIQSSVAAGVRSRSPGSCCRCGCAGAGPCRPRP